MKILVLGYDGYIGYPLTLNLLEQGHEVIGVDNFSRRSRVKEVGSDSLTPILSALGRRSYIRHKYPNFRPVLLALGQAPGIASVLLEETEPDCIVHLAEQPSAPWSMHSDERAFLTQQENVLGTLDLLWAMKQHCPTAHLIKLGTMGEYGTPDCNIPEGKIPERCLHDWNEMEPVYCPMRGLLFPRTPGSFYHASKVMDTINIEFCCRNWGLRSTDIMQGVLFGVRVDDNSAHERLTRFDYDEYFGTVINRFCTQAIIEFPLTVYGKGDQTRGFLPLKDSIQCLNIAINNPPEQGEYRTLNQFESIYSINNLATTVAEAADALGLRVTIKHIANPRKEAEEHYYNPDHQKLFDLGYVPTTDIRNEITNLILDILPFKDRVKERVILPKTKWS